MSDSTRRRRRALLMAPVSSAAPPAPPLPSIPPKFWWDATRVDGVGMGIQGATVGAWLDVINGTSLAQATEALKPVYQVASMNGKPGVRFVRANSTQLTATANITDKRGASYYTVVRLDVGVGVFFSDPNADTGVALGAGGQNFDFDEGLQVALYGGVRWIPTNVSYGGNNNVLISSIIISEDGTTPSMYIDNVLTGSYAGAAAATTTGSLSVGHRFGGNFFGGDMGDLLIYDTPHNASDRNLVFAYLMDKYSIV